jgi:TetR/AcrR family transcriptional regulator, ethionamide resistance regulator
MASTTVSEHAAQHRRRQRRRQDAEREILDAAERLLRTRLFRELTVDDVMAATTQSRTAFYRHFTDRHRLLIRLMEEVGEELYAMADTWLSGSGDPAAEGREALERLADVYQAHGALLRAASEAAHHDSEVEQVYQRLLDRFVAATAARIERDIAAGRVRVPDARQAATALVWMNERYLAIALGEPGVTDRATALDTLATIWIRALYGSDPAGT